MRINRFEAIDLHGYLSFDLAFRPDLTFLVGINGSGKTSAVRAMVALLTPALRDLGRTEFKRLAVTAEHDGRELRIEAEKNDEELVIRTDGVDEPLRIPRISRAAFERRQTWEEHELAFYRDQEALLARHPVMVRLSEVPTPMFLDLERKAQVGIHRRHAAHLLNREHPASPSLLSGSLMDSLRDAQVVAEAAFRENLAKQRQLADDLKQELILTHFRPPNEQPGFFDLEIPSQQEVRRLRRRREMVFESLSALGIHPSAIDENVEPFFQELFHIADRLRGHDLEELIGQDTPEATLLRRWLAIQPQLERINSVIRHVETYNKRLEETIRPIQRYLDLVNKFLTDSGKQLRFRLTGDLQVAVGDLARPISALSSGERQLVVILTHLAFNHSARRANVLIIDEPELSLHIRWQEQFVDALRGASAKLQLILATHSPSIIMDRDEYCVDVFEARRDPVQS